MICGLVMVSDGPFLSVAKERGKERQQEPRFLHLLARDNLCKSGLYNNSSFAVEIKMDATAA